MSLVEFALESSATGSMFMGRVTDLGSGLPLGGIRVEVFTLAGASVAVTHTCRDGRYSLRVPNLKVPVRVQMTGVNYDLFELNVDPDADPNLNAALSLLVEEEVLGTLEGKV